MIPKRRTNIIHHLAHQTKTSKVSIHYVVRRECRPKIKCDLLVMSCWAISTDKTVEFEYFPRHVSVICHQ